MEMHPRDAARLLRRSAIAGALATVTGGQPVATLVTPAPAPDGSLLILLSGLSDHTAHLTAEPRCSLLLQAALLQASPGPDPNPAAHARLTLIGIAAPELDPVLKQRWIARHPYAAFYADLGDFRLWRIRPSAGQYIGGFGSATRLTGADLTPDPVAVAAIAAAEPAILDHCNTDHADAMARLAGRPAIAGGEPWRMTACDVDGCDLTAGHTVIRIPWPAPADSPAAIRSALVKILHRTLP